MNAWIIAGIVFAMIITGYVMYEIWDVINFFIERRIAHKIYRDDPDYFKNDPYWSTVWNWREW